MCSRFGMPSGTDSLPEPPGRVCHTTGMWAEPINGVLLLAGLSFLAIGFLGWISINEPDQSARLWLSAFICAGFAPLLGVQNVWLDQSWVFVGSTLSLTLSFLLFGLSLKVLYSPDSEIRECVQVFAIVLLSYAVALGYFFEKLSIPGQASLFAVGAGLAAIWATSQAVHLTKRTQSRFAAHLAIIFGIQAAVLFIRVPQVWLGAGVRLGDQDPAALLVVFVLSLCGIVKAISYFALRLEEVRNRVEAESVVVREQAQQLAQRNAEIVAALHAVPVACVVTKPTLEVIYLNAEARRLLGDQHLQPENMRLSDGLVGMRGAPPVAIASLRYALLRTADKSETLALELSVSGVDNDAASAQWVFLLKPAICSEAMMTSLWSAIPRVEDRTLLLVDDHGRVVSAQSAWGDVLGRYAVFDSPELRFGGISEPRDAAGMNLWHTLRRFGGADAKIDKAQAECKAGRGTSLLLRDESGAQLTVAISWVRDGNRAETKWLVELFWRARTSPPTARTIVSKKSVDSTIDQKATEEIPAFLRK